MSSNLLPLYQQPDILFYIYSFLPIQDVANLFRMSFANRQMMRRRGDVEVFRSLILHLPIVPQEDKTLLCEFEGILKHEHCKELLREFYVQPFKSKSLSEHPIVYSYSYKGGVIDFTEVVPCKLLVLIMKHFRAQLCEKIKISLHKFMLMIGTEEWELDENTKFHLGYPDKQTEFSNMYIPNSDDIPDYESVLMGKGLLMMLNNFEECKRNGHDGPLSISISGSKSFVLYLDLLENANPKPEYRNLFVDCANPPYNITESCDYEITNLTTYFYNDFDNSCDHFNWKDCLEKEEKTWSNYWTSGMEWWGCHAITTYDYRKDRFIVSICSTSD